MPPRDIEPAQAAAPSFRVATWNVEWARPGTARGERVRSALVNLSADVLIVTEGFPALLPDGGYTIDAGDDWGYENKTGRRKVLAWSRSPWTEVESITEGASCGRIVIGRTETALGEIDVISVCIPWRDAHVNTGRRGARPWTEHLECCDVLANMVIKPHTVIAGDFNQRVPRYRQPIAVAAALDKVLAPFRLWTGGSTEVGPLIDHIATTPDLRVDQVSAWGGRDSDGPLSDHAGVAVDLSCASAQAFIDLPSQ